VAPDATSVPKSLKPKEARPTRKTGPIADQATVRIGWSEPAEGERWAKVRVTDAAALRRWVCEQRGVVRTWGRNCSVTSLGIAR